jgi:N-methylhydantoinase B
VLRYELVEGSGGAGRFRGGMGLWRVYRAEAECQLRLDRSRLLTPPWGLNGGHPGGAGVEAFVNGSGRLRRGERVEIITPGAGGYGSASERDPAALERDVADGRIKKLHARSSFERCPAPTSCRQCRGTTV